MSIRYLAGKFRLLIAGITDRAKAWGPVISTFTAFQLAIQGMSALAGLIFVRYLTKGDFAFLTISATWLGAFANLTNCGVYSAAIAFGGQHWQDRNALSSVIASCQLMRKRLIVVTLVPLVVALIWNLRITGASYAVSAAIAFFVLIAGFCQIPASILIVVPRLKGETRQLQWIDGINASMRLVLAIVAAALYLDIFVALAISVWGNIYQLWLVRKVASRHIDLNAPATPELVARTRSLVNRQWLNEINGVFQGQISIVLLSFFGTTSAVADFGALGRVSIIFAAFGGTLQNVILPRYARCQDARKVGTLYTQIMLFFAGIAIMPSFVTWLMPQPFLWILGPKYGGLGAELTLAMLATGLGFLNAFSWSLNTARAWIIPGGLLVPASLLIQITLIFLVGVATLRQVLILGILSNFAFMSINVGATLIFSRRFTRL